MSSTWILVADASRARFFSAENPAGPLVEMETLSNPEARLHERDLVSDRGGHNDGDSATKAANTDRFASMVCDHLESSRHTRELRKLYILGSPGFLGLLRKHQSPSLRHLVRDEIAKDLTTQSPERIRAQLPDYL
jgi:protein required for attachment to host cells